MLRKMLCGAALLSFVLVGASGCGDGAKPTNPTIQGGGDPNLKPTTPAGGAPGGGGNKPAPGSQ